jgi:RHS repeat-associated protein
MRWAILLAMLVALAPPLHFITVDAAGSQTAPTDPIPQAASYGGFNPVAPNLGVCSAADPVECSDGDFYQNYSLISIPGLGVPLQLSLSYNSALASQASSVGYGWSFNYGMSLSQSGDLVTITAANGSTVVFTQSGSTYTPPTWVQATLTNENGYWLYDDENDEIAYDFNPSGQLIYEFPEGDPNSYLTTLTYGSNLLTTVTDTSGRTLTFAHNSSGQLTKVTDPAGRTVTLAYDSSGDLTSITNTGGGVTSLTYDSGHHLLTVKDPRGETTTNTYNSADQVATQKDPLGNETQFSYSGTYPNVVTTVTDPLGNKTQLTYQYGLLTQAIEALGTSSAATWTYLYDPNSLGMTSETDPNGNTTTYTYSSSGQLLTETDPLGHKTTYTYNSMGEVATETDPLGVTTTNTYDAHGNLLSSSTPLVGSNGVAATNSYAYSSTEPGEMLTSTNPDGDTTTYTYDSYGDAISSTTPLGEKTTWTYNTIGEMLTSVSPKGNVSGGTPANFTTTYTYNGLGQETSVTDPMGDKTSYTYDADGNQTVVTDPLGNTTTTTYNADHEPTKVATANSAGTVLQTTSQTYDADGNTLTATNGAGNVTTYTYGRLNQVASTKTPLGDVTSYTYDGDGNLLTTTDPSGRVTTDAYNADDEVTGVTYSDGTTPDVKYTYDADGQRLSMTDGSGTTTYVWNSLHQLTSVTDGAGYAVTYGYDLAGNETSIGYPGEGTVKRSYNADGELTTVTDWLSNEVKLAYDPNGNLTSIAYPGTATETRGYDDANRLTSISANAVEPLTETYGYNDDSQVTSASGASVDYDALGRVTQSTLLASGNSYTYDAADRITEFDGSMTDTYNSGSELLTATMGDYYSGTYGYNPEGDRTSSDVNENGGYEDVAYTYDQAGRLLTDVEQGTGTSYEESFSYNGDGQLVTSHVTSDPGPVSFIWDESSEAPQLLETVTASDSAADCSYIYGPGGLTLEQICDGVVSYFFHNWQGSTVELESYGGHSAGTWSYDPYGNTYGSAGYTDLLFEGQYEDPVATMYYFQDRWYDPTTEQFVSPDALNPEVPYAYAADDPVNLSDPTGEMLAKAPGTSGPAAVAPPPAASSEQAAYYHQLAKESAPAPAPRAQSAPVATASVSPAPGDQGAVNALHTAAVVTADGALGADTVSLAAYGLALAPTPAAPALATVATGALITGIGLNILSCSANGALDFIGHGSILFTASTCFGIIPGAIGGGLSYVFRAESIGTQAAVGVATGVHGVITDGINFIMNNVL